jgi:hypothetical protein
MSGHRACFVSMGALLVGSRVVTFVQGKLRLQASHFQGPQNLNSLDFALSRNVTWLFLLAKKQSRQNRKKRSEPPICTEVVKSGPHDCLVSTNFLSIRPPLLFSMRQDALLFSMRQDAEGLQRYAFVSVADHLSGAPLHAPPLHPGHRKTLPQAVREPRSQVYHGTIWDPQISIVCTSL